MYARRACCPEWGKLSERKVSKFFSYFLYFTKSRKKFPKGTSLAACRQRSREAAKDLILPQRSRSCGELNRGLENLEASCEGERLVTFCVVQKVTKKHARTCKKLPVASFCASETAETGRIANGREQGDHVSRSRLRPATSIQSSAKEDFRKVFRQHEPKPVFRTKRRRKGFESVRRSGVTAKGVRADDKRMAVFFADSRLWLGANLRCLWWKRVVWDGNKERLVQTESVWFAKKCCF